MQVFRVTDVVAANDVLKFFIFKNILCAWRRLFPVKTGSVKIKTDAFQSELNLCIFIFLKKHKASV